MRALILIAGAALALGACRNNDQAGNAVNLDQGLTADTIASNDVTAIDAVTGADANMAADVNYIDTADYSSGSGTAPSGSPRKAAPAATAAAPGNTIEPSAGPVGNAVTSTTANNSL